MTPLRIFLGPMPEMLRTIVNDLLSRETDIVMVGGSSDIGDPLLRARHEGANVLITEEAPNESSCLTALMSGPPLSIFVIGADGREAAAINLARKRVGLESGSQATLAEAIRRIAGELNPQAARDLQ